MGKIIAQAFYVLSVLLSCSPDSMEKGKLERSQRALEQWVQQHPEEVRRLRELAKPSAEFLNSSEWDAFWLPAKAAILQGDETGIRAWVEDRDPGSTNPIFGALSRCNL